VRRARVVVLRIDVSRLVLDVGTAEKVPATVVENVRSDRAKGQLLLHAELLMFHFRVAVEGVVPDAALVRTTSDSADAGSK